MKLFKVAVATIAVLFAALVIGEAQITIPYNFTTGSTISSSQVNANFSALGAAACNLTGCTMQGILTTLGVVPATNATYDIGSSAAKYANLFLSGTTSLNSQTYTWPATQVASGTLQTNGSGALAWAPLQLEPCGLRLTLTSGTPVTTADVTAATSVFVTPFRGGVCAFYDGSTSWTALSTSEVTVAVPATTSTMYDVFCYNSSGLMACEALAWTNDTTRATALTTQNSVYVKSGATTRRYIGSFRTTTVSGQTEDSAAKRLVWSYYNRVRRMIVVTDATSQWNYTLAGYRQANANPANQAAIVVGVAESPIELRVVASATNSGASPGVTVYVAIGLDGTAAFTAGEKTTPANVFASAFESPSASSVFIPTAGYHFYTWMEYSNAVGTTTWNGTTASPFSTSGMLGFVEG